MKSVNFHTRHNEYLMKTGVEVSYDDFMKVKVLSRIHKSRVGSVIEHYNPNLRIYPHMKHFGHMFFFKKLSVNQLFYGPTVADDMIGPCH